MAMNARDVISGRQGVATAVIDGSVENLFYLQNIEIEVEWEKEEFRALGTLALQNKVVGWAGTGSMTIKYVTSVWRRMMANYASGGQAGIAPEFIITVTNDDVQSSARRQTISITGVIIDGGMFGRLDVDEGVMDEDIEFTFTGKNMPQQFQQAVHDFNG